MTKQTTSDYREVDRRFDELLVSYDIGDSFTSSITEPLNLDGEKEFVVKEFIHSELDRVREEARIKGYEEGAEDMSEKIEDIRQSAIKECLEALPKESEDCNCPCVEELCEHIGWDNYMVKAQTALTQLS